MTDKINEQISAFMDDALESHEAELLVARLTRDRGLRATWQRYHLAGEAMRRGLAGTHDRGFADGVMAGIADVEIESRSVNHPARLLDRLRPAVGLAVAASVAMVAIFTVQQPVMVADNNAAPSEIVPQQATSNPAGAMPMYGTQQVGFSGVKSPELQNQLRSYLMNHNEHSQSSRVRGVMPYVQIAAFESKPALPKNETEAELKDQVDDSDKPKTERR